MYAYDVLSVIANLAGIPSGSIPAGTVDGIPVGFHLVADSVENLSNEVLLLVLHNLFFFG